MQRLWPFVLLSLSWDVDAGAASRNDEAVDYLRDVKPVLKERCYACHGALKQKGKLRVDTVAAMLKGGAVLPGDSSRSPLVQRMLEPDPDVRMPFEGAVVPAREVARIKAWIDAGARAPAAEEPEPPPSAHWAFRPPVRPAVPAVRNPGWVRTPIDAFILSALERDGLSPAPPAPKDVLLRRVTFDLVGLPPAVEDLRAFRADGSERAYERVVDGLLSRPQHGERWGRHWMDVWRYSDWYGVRSESDVRQSYGQIWRWRDWIVRSLNAGKGYDRMVVEMLAADEVAPEDPEALAATGFLVRNWYGWNRNQWMRDLVEHTGKAFLGLTMNCAHCHDHKYDPITQEDYFRFRAFFEPLQLRHDRVPGEPDPGPFKDYTYGAKTPPMKSGMVRVFDANPEAETFLYTGGDERNRPEGGAPIPPGPPAFLGSRIAIEPVDLPPTARYPGLKPFIRAEEIGRRREAAAAARAALAKADEASRAAAEARLQAAEADLVAIQVRIAADDGAPAGAAAASAERLAGLLAAQARMAEAEVAVRSASDRKKADAELAAARKALEAARKAAVAPPAGHTPLSPTYPSRSSGRRRALAGWIVSPANPLTARVAVNHVWLRHFGTPLVDSVFDFGRNAKPPTHPELLDWLAVEFMESGWSLKHLHRLIVTSAAYRMASGPPRPDLRCYPEHRLEAEAVRDGLLAASGGLDPEMGGPDLDNASDVASRRRSLYFSHFAEDGGRMKFLEIFDAADPTEAYRRHPSITPQQALALTNSRLAVDSARRLAGTLADLPDDAFVIEAFERILSRRPSDAEAAACSSLLRGGPSGPSRESVVRVLFSHHDFVTVR
ncbi:MAG TPA: PSD1 and planctomycete cytochrome C domain-containing protein [Planctomycetota bacterium]|nr:PSD1 and planctomycete cytochrome C domain-containing protein [Planctomycetota bacterium]